MKATEKAKLAARKSAQTPLAHGVGRRKTAVARVWLRPGKGKGAIIVNDTDYLAYFDTHVARTSAHKPFDVFPQGAMYDAQANVAGGGVEAQADAVKLAISRALCLIDEQARPVFKEHGLLTVDSRVKERKKYGQKAARRKFQFVKR